MGQSGGAARSAAPVLGMRCLTDLDEEGRYGWRLVASNGRPVAVSAGSYDTHARCRAAFVRLCERHAGIAGGIQHSAEGGGWVWVLWEASGRHLARSARMYERHATCRSSYERFRAMVPELAAVGPELWGET
ncbi:hypothetical protein ABZX69_25225 [Streptomyces sp. NPDC004074]|uniref:hypothetical protein n=1 Tax=unclassified Streptomyces TaxID=2593676 RepID=UPI0033B6AE33